jgi:hypothetical protein
MVDRHLTRHQQKDEEAGGEGLGVIETRKKAWKDANGNIVSKRPDQGDMCRSTAKRRAIEPLNHVQHEVQGLTEAGGFPNSALRHAEPISPPKSMLSAESLDGYSHLMPQFLTDTSLNEPTSTTDIFDFLANSSWGSQVAQNSVNAQLDLPFDDIFTPDTGNVIRWDKEMD